MNEFERETFSKELIWKIGFELSPKELIHFCMSSTHINNVLCQDEDFWQQRFIDDFPEFWNPDIEPLDSWKKFYEHFALEDFLLALEEQDADGVHYYLSSGIDPNINIGGEPALFWATSNENVEIIKLFIEAGVDPNLQSEKIKGYTALHDTIEHLSENETVQEDEDTLLIVRLLYEAGVNLDMKTEYGWSPLMMAAHQQEAEMFNLLLLLGASPLTEEERSLLAERYYR